jgi:hypothetical protein
MNRAVPLRAFEPSPKLGKGRKRFGESWADSVSSMQQKKIA